MTKLICGLIVALFTMLGLARVADLLDSNVRGNATASDACDSHPVCNGERRA